ncbi:hypothetical protein B0H13DRAFT_2265769 [Mycena leptocephala]|nr:hypothetical protein B0H13DRAFT_2265769 [Mycena leptocephala]
MNFSLSYPRLKLAVPPTLVRVDLPAQVLRSSLTNALTEPVFSTFKSSGLRAGRRDVLSDAQHDPPTWRSLPYKTPNSSLKTQSSPSSPSSAWARVLKLQAISVIEFHSRLAYYRATDYQRYCSEEWGCARWGDDGRACAQCSTGARELRQVVQKYGHRLGIIARGLTSTREKGIGRAAWRGRGRVDVHGPEKRGREQGSRSREGKEVREGGGSGLGRGWDAPTLARVGVDAGIARAAARRDSGCRRASAARRGYCELARIRRNRCVRSAEGGGMGAGEGRGWNGMGGGTGTWRQSWEPRTRARSSVVVEVGGGVCGDTGRRQRGGGWDMRRGASTGIHRCSRGGGRRRCGGGTGRAGRDRERHECAKTDRHVERTQRDGLGNADVRAGGAGAGRDGTGAQSRRRGRRGKWAWQRTSGRHKAGFVRGGDKAARDDGRGVPRRRTQ